MLAASNRNLSQRVREGAFRRDLFHRITVFTLELPPLRARKADLKDLVPLFVAEYNLKAGKGVRVVPDAVWSALQAHDWPGNVRELRNVIERCVLLSDSATLAAQWLQLESAEPAPAGRTALSGPLDIVLRLDGSMSLDDIEKHVLSVALERSNFNVTGAARLLGASRETLRYRINKYGLRSNG